MRLVRAVPESRDARCWELGRVLAWPRALTRRATGCAPQPPQPSFLWLPAADGAFTPTSRTAEQPAAKVIVDAARLAAGRFLGRRRHAHATDPPRPHRNTARQATALRRPGQRRSTAASSQPAANAAGRAGCHATRTDRCPVRPRSPLLRVLHNRTDQHAEQRQHHRAPEGRANRIHGTWEPGSLPGGSSRR